MALYPRIFNEEYLSMQSRLKISDSSQETGTEETS